MRKKETSLTIGKRKVSAHHLSSWIIGTSPPLYRTTFPFFNPPQRSVSSPYRRPFGTSIHSSPPEFLRSRCSFSFIAVNSNRCLHLLQNLYDRHTSHWHDADSLCRRQKTSSFFEPHSSILGQKWEQIQKKRP